jgi:hypothetical protein
MNRSNYQRAAEKFFVHSVAAILLLTALAKVFSAGGSARILSLNDPLLMIPTRSVLLLAAVVELGVAAFLLRAGRTEGNCLLVLWLGTVFIAYRLFLAWLAPGQPCPCLGTVADNLPLRPQTVDLLLRLAIAYLFLGSALLLGATRLDRARVTSGGLPADSHRDP